MGSLDLPYPPVMPEAKPAAVPAAGVPPSGKP